MSPVGTKLYRTARWAVILAAIGLMVAQIGAAQGFSRDKKNKGPRALGLLELSSSGKARLVPIAILIDGEFYDAGAYKAAPVPMALESGTVYEAVRTGVSQGLFTVSGALEANHNWIAEGTWQSASALAAAAAAAAKKKEAQSKPAPEPVEGPPVLRRASSAKPAEPPPPAPPAASKPDAKPSAPAPAASAAGAPEPPAASAAPASSSGPAVSEEDDPNRPVLKRGAPSPAEVKKRNAPVASPAKAAAQTPADAHKASTPASSASGSSAAGSMQLIPAISDADGPDPRPYAFSLKPDEEQKLRKKILAMAGDEVRARAAQLAGEPQPATHPSASGTKGKPLQPNFEAVQFRAFDLSNSNEPVLVVTAKARMPARPNAAGADLQYIITLVTRDDMYGELHKVFSSITDTQHFDVLARMELIDAVDADGDGRGELLFRQVSDAGSAFILYRVIGDRLWPLFQGTPGQ
jgi:hypothetical protein